MYAVRGYTEVSLCKQIFVTSLHVPSSPPNKLLPYVASSLLKEQRWAIFRHESTLNILWIFNVVLKPVLPFLIPLDFCPADNLPCKKWFSLTIPRPHLKRLKYKANFAHDQFSVSFVKMSASEELKKVWTYTVKTTTYPTHAIRYSMTIICTTRTDDYQQKQRRTTWKRVWRSNMAATTWVAQHPVIKSSLRRVLHFKQSNVSNNYVNENTNSGLGEGLHSDIRVRVHSATEVVNHPCQQFHHLWGD